MKKKPDGSLSLDRSVLEYLVHAAIRAPSAANLQPWQWVQMDDALVLLHDDSRSRGSMLLQECTDFVNLGAALENLVLAAHALKLEVHIDTWPFHRAPNVVAVLQFFSWGAQKESLEPHTADALVQEIGRRHTTRQIVPRTPIGFEHLAALDALAHQLPEVSLRWLTKEEDILTLASMVGKSERLCLGAIGRRLNPASWYGA